MDKKLQMYSKIGMRAAFGSMLYEHASNNDNNNLIVLSADTSTSAGLDKFRKNFPSKYVECSIAEQNMICIAGGLASDGWNVFATTFSPFITLRVLEQIKLVCGYNKLPIKLVGLASGISLGDLGYSHCSIEDVSVLRAIPNLTILSPSDTNELYALMPQIIAYPGSIYLRLTGNVPVSILQNDINSEIGAYRLINCGNPSNVIFVTGVISSEVLSVVNDNPFLKNEVSIYCVNTLTEYADNKLNFLKIASHAKKIISVEEHSILGGLGTLLSEWLSESAYNPQFLRIGHPAEYLPGATYDLLKKRAGIDKISLAEKFTSFFELE